MFLRGQWEDKNNKYNLFWDLFFMLVLAALVGEAECVQTLLHVDC